MLLYIVYAIVKVRYKFMTSHGVIDFNIYVKDAFYKINSIDCEIRRFVKSAWETFGKANARVI